MSNVVTEFDLVKKFQKALKNKDDAELLLEKATAEYDRAEFELIELLEAKDATRTAEYQGLGHVTLLKPKLYASVLAQNRERLFEFLRSINRDDMIKEEVNASTLSSFVGERVKKGEPVPEFVGYYLTSKAKFYPAKGSK